ncbi:MAG: GatB/YqeY domain-containing protein, partial [Candidatus Omnitrophica bacterium]|nr:GatB/YqeY domain-containing protein [Candidatus Omnitrophota bacterium]
MLEEKIYKDYLSALKERDKHRINFLSFIRSELKNQAFNLKKDKLEDAEALVVLSKQKKRLDESRESMASSGRSDLLGDIDKELSLINEYLPVPLDNNEVVTIVERT